MNELQRRKATKLVEELEWYGPSHGAVILTNGVLARGPGAPFTDVPLLHYEPADVSNAVELGLLQKVEMVDADQKHLFDYYRSVAAGLRTYVLRSPEEVWQFPLDDQVFSYTADENIYWCVTPDTINFWNTGKLTRCDHNKETLERYRKLAQRRPK